MIERSRPRLLAWSGALLGLFAVLALLVTRDRSPLDGFDQLGRQAENWADDHDWIITVLRWTEVLTATVAMTVATILVAGVLLLRRQVRAGLYAGVVMGLTAAVTTAVKLGLSRDRPEWQNALEALTTKSFPSGHTSSVTAFAGVLVVLAWIFVRRASMRRAVLVSMTALWLVVALDRVLLGRHFPTDVVGGTLLGVGTVLLVLAFLPPEPPGHAVKADPLPDVITTGRRVAVILNPSKVEDVGQFRALVSGMAAESGWSPPTWHFTTVEDSGTGMAEAAAISGADLVLVCGGDGTVREVCAELAGTGIPVGVVPAGTGNLLARNLDIPLYLRSAVDVALNGQDRAIDLVRVEGDGIEAGTHFMVMAGMGFDAAIMEGVNEDIKKKVGWIAYVFSALKALMFPAVRVDVSVDGGEFTRHRARTVVVGNVGFLQAGMPLLPDAAIDDGLLDVVILHPKRFLSWVPLAFRVLAKRSRTDETINRMTGRTVEIRAHSDTPRQLDGDAVGPGRTLRMECLHGRLLVRVPR
ncbi:YegS/Rv2252/BmrU family lipid kinase [Nocardioides coralli]|uniref:YegS/Rv2252/BmrU family lipid kinase n=1 Tax=Nocardioides coralli TaxID=2872154 RepID=UPI002017014B|nr:YegS/Rv2252/BmrU family lipid kinase [Nocardioides coralli]